MKLPLTGLLTLSLTITILALLSTPSRAATVTGTLQDISLQSLDTKLMFTPTNQVLVTGTGLSAGPPRLIDSTSGQFSLVLDAGDYTVSLPLISWRQPFVISVFTTNGTVNITNLLAAPLTYTYTNNLSANLSVSTSISVDGPQVYYDWTTLSNGVVAIPSWNLGHGMARPPGLYFFNTNGSEMGSLESWADHAGVAGKPETLFKSMRNIAILPGNDAVGDSWVQLGQSGSDHAMFGLQYDDNPSSTNYNDGLTSFPIGHSKRLAFTGRGATSPTGSAYSQAYPGLVGVVSATNLYSSLPTGYQQLGELWFYASLPLISGGSFATYPGLRIGRMLTNGWDLRGKLIQERAISSSSASTLALSFNSAFNPDISLSASTVTLSTTGQSAGSTNYERRVFYLRGGAASTLVYPGGVTGWNTNGIALPASLLTAQMIRLELEATSLGETNVQVVSAQLLSDNTFTWDADALSFFTRASITDPIQKAAVNTLALNAKANGWWTNCDVIYPFVGGNSTAHSKNLKANAFNITWAGSGVTHGANGVTFDGVNGFGDTTFNPSTAGGVYVQNSGHAFAYVQSGINWSSANGGSSVIGAVGGGNYANLGHVNGSLVLIGRCNDSAQGAVQTMTDERGPMLTTRTASAAQHTAWRSAYVDSATSSTGLPSASFYLGAENNGGLWKPAPATLAGAALGGGMTQAQWDTFRADWDTFENTLSRRAP